MAMASSLPPGKRPATIGTYDEQEKKLTVSPIDGAKKLTIKNLRPHAPDRELKQREYYTKAQVDVNEALDAILAGTGLKIPFERLYKATEDLCRKGYASAVHRSLKEKAEKHLNRTVLSRIVRDGGGRDADTLLSVLAEWKLYNKQMVCSVYFDKGFFWH